MQKISIVFLLFVGLSVNNAAAFGDGPGGGPEEVDSIVRQLFNNYPLTNEEIAMQMLDNFRDMEYRRLAFFSHTPKLCEEMSCVSLDPALVKSMAQLALSERQNAQQFFWSGTPAWIAAAAAVLSGVLGLFSFVYAQRASRRAVDAEDKLQLIRQREHSPH